ncbi:serine/threonine-protein kinase polo-like [Drosophila miranda]|uniref:serine/threonine-protein kinase polo-like n=1 Tax=Drosophila miranda TaxID=7229 RepID=UPI00143F3624|nr:serine/threonine-protein kinase polo-like [Drosophila miranda]
MYEKPEDKNTDIPDSLYDSKLHRTYKRLSFFGRGNFAKCYEIIDVETDDVFAGKIVSKKLIINNHQKEKMVQEIAIHRSLNHPNIVKFHSYFDDIQNIYIVLELCKKRSLMELHKRRRSITEYECRYYIYQIVQGVKYLHDKCIIHRDLKLGNLFLNDMLHVKIGDFGLATRIEYEGERKKTLCGTPNYVAPEILNKKGHSFEVDIWSIGCVMYTLLVGQPPFETKSLKDTYSRIKKCEYRVPTYLRKPAADMVISMLQPDPSCRPAIGQLLNYDFLKGSRVPTSLPSSCLAMAPRIALNDTIGDPTHRQPLMQMYGVRVEANLHDTITASFQLCRHNEDYRSDIESLHQQLTHLINKKPCLLPGNLGDENTDPAAQPLFWISKWVDYSDKYGFGYQLLDEGIGIMFNDTTKLILLPNHINVHYIDKDGKESYMTTSDYCKTLEKKMKLLSYFQRYMIEHLVIAGADNVNIESDQVSRLPHLHSWFRTTCAVAMHLTNGTVQLNFSDHMKLILCPRLSAITYIDREKNFRTYRFSTIAENGVSKDVYPKIRYAQEKLRKMLEKMFD